MENVDQTEDTTFLPQNLSKSKVFGLLMGFEVLMVFFGLIQPEGGLYNGGLSHFFGVFFGNELFYDASIQNMTTVGLYAVLNTICLAIAVFAREQERVQKQISLIFLTIVFGFSLTQMFKFASSNYLLMFFSLSFIPAGYYYYMVNGEILSISNNRVIVYALRRTFAIVPMFLAIAAFTFFGVNFIGDPIELATARVRYNKEQVQETLLRRYGLLNEQGERIPDTQRFFMWLNDFIHGDFGISYYNENPVSETLGTLIKETLKMQVTALIFSFVFSIIIGILAAYYHKTPADSSISAIALLGLSMPIFVSGILLIIIFGGTGFDIFPVQGAYSLDNILVQENNCPKCVYTPSELWELEGGENWTNPGWFFGTYLKVLWVRSKDNIIHLILPIATLTFATMATFSRLTRSTMLEVMRQDYILAARANGLSEQEVLSKHALKNVMLPLVTYLGISIGTILIGAPITETVFQYPGLGRKFISALEVLDIPWLMTLTMIITVMILFTNLVTDISYTYLDPRIEL